MIDTRREATHIARQFGRYHNTIGEAAIWFVFDADRSRYDDVYDEGYRRYEAGRRVPLLWVDQQEAQADYSPEGRRPTERIRLAMGARAVWEAGINITEAHGTSIHSVVGPVWRRDRLNDVIYYGGHFYSISAFHIKGRVQDQDVIIGVAGIEIFPTDESNLDVTPRDWFAPTDDGLVPPRPVTDNRTHIFYGDEPPADPEIGDLWFNPDYDIDVPVPLGAAPNSDYDSDEPVPFGEAPPDEPEVGDFWLKTDNEE